MPFMLALKGHQMKTVELSLLRFDGNQNMFLAKPEAAPPVEQKWRVVALRWSAEREPFVILTHRETSRLRLVVAKPDSACELWPVMYSSDQPDGGIANSPVNPAQCRLTPIMHQGGLYVVAAQGPQGRVAVFQINSPTEPWVCVCEDLGVASAKFTPFYIGETPWLVAQSAATSGVEAFEFTPSGLIAHPKPSTNRDMPLRDSRIRFAYCRRPTGSGLAVFATWIDGCMLFLAEVSKGSFDGWKVVNSVPVPPHSRLGTVYVPFLSEPLLVTSSMDPHYVGFVAVRRLFLSERLLGGHSEPPRIIRYMQVPAMPVSIRDLTADLPITDLPYREFIGDFVNKVLAYDLSVMAGGLPPPPKAPGHSPVPILAGSSLGNVRDKSRLDLVLSAQETRDWRITPLRWAPPNREVLFVILQSAQKRTTRIAIATEGAKPEDWPVQIEFADSTIPFSECVLTPFQFQTVPGASDLFVVAQHGDKGALFFIPNPRGDWQLVREEEDLRDIRAVMYHRSKDVNVSTFFVLGNGDVRVVIEPNQPTFLLRQAAPMLGGEMHMLYAFSPKPPVTHVWPCEVFACQVDPQEGLMRVVHVASPDGEWRELYQQSIPKNASVAPLYLSYLAEPVLLVSSAGGIDVVRLNLIESLSTGFASAPRFVHRYLALNGPELRDLTLDAPLVWVPQMGMQGMHPYSGYPLPFEKE